MALNQSHYEINVSEKQDEGCLRMGSESWGSRYRHLFATDERSCVTHSDMLKVYAALKTAFPEPQYKVDVTHNEAVGHRVDSDLLTKQAKAQGWIK